MRWSRKSSPKGCSRELSVGARQWQRVRWSSFCEQCVELAVGTTGATVTSLRLFKPRKGSAVRPDQNRVVPRNVLRPCLIGAFFLYHFPPKPRSQWGKFREEFAKQSGNTYFCVPVFLQGRFLFVFSTTQDFEVARKGHEFPEKTSDSQRG